MAGNNYQFHLTSKTEIMERVRKEANELGISMNELINRKLSREPVQEEIILIRKLRILLIKKSNGGI